MVNAHTDARCRVKANICRVPMLYEYVLCIRLSPSMCAFLHNAIIPIYFI